MAKSKAMIDESPPSPDLDELDPSESPSASATPTARKGAKPSFTSKPRLTAHQKNTNHKDAENKRRNAIREQFTELASLVPGAEGLERSEYVMLQKTIVHFREEIEERRRLLDQAETQGVAVESDLTLGDEQHGGVKFQTTNVDEFETLKRKRLEKEGNVYQNNDRDAEDSLIL